MSHKELCSFRVPWNQKDIVKNDLQDKELEISLTNNKTKVHVSKLYNFMNFGCC